jgi:hypothetical protein
LNDLEIDALAFGVRNGINTDNYELLNSKYSGEIQAKGKNRFLHFLANYSKNIDSLDKNKFNKKKIDHIQKVKLEKREIFFTTNYTSKLADEIRLFRIKN